jgi:Protein of unknown function (DUF1353)
MIHGKCARSLIALAAALLAGGCVALTPRQPAISGGELSGQLALAWDDGYTFVAYPVKGKELTYKFPKGHRLEGALGEIRPKLMYTDGGSIPRTFWSFDGLSPWEYGPAFILHDWVFLRHYCDGQKYPVTLEEANDILLDAMILLDKQVAKRHGRRPHNKEDVRTLIDAAVTRFSANAWNNGKCLEPQGDLYKVIFETKTLRSVKTVAGRSIIVERYKRVPKTVPRYRELFVMPTS